MLVRSRSRIEERDGRQQSECHSLALARQSRGTGRQATILTLQQTVGNRAVGALLQTRPRRSGTVQPKLIVSQPGDQFEQEADRIAGQALQAPTAGATESVVAPPDQSQPAAEPEIRALRSGGEPLPEPVRRFFEPRLGHDFSDVRVHTDREAAESAERLNASAYTVGNEVVFGSGQYAPQTGAGQRLLGHELAHVAQQRSGIIARAVAANYATIKDNLTYGLLDWAITDAEAHEVLVILGGLSPTDLEDTIREMEKDGLVTRLLENISSADRTAFGPLIQTIHQKRGASATARHIESLMSYGLLDWVITDEEAHMALEALKSLQPVPKKLRDVVVAIPGKQYERFFDNLSGADRSANLRFLQDLEMIRRTGMTLEEMSAAQKTHLEAQAMAAGVSVGTFIRGEASARGYGGHAAVWWPSLTPAEKAAWTARFTAAVAAVKASVSKEVKDIITAAEAAGGGIQFKPEEVEELGPSIYAFRQGNILGVGKLWVETAETDPADVVENIVHELGGHLEYGETASWDIMQGTLAALPPAEQAIAGSGPRHLYSAYQYMETEIYAELRELPYRTPGSRGDEPAQNVEDELNDLKAAFAPAIAEAVVRGFRRRISLDSRISAEARKLYDEKVKVVFGITF